MKKLKEIVSLVSLVVASVVFLGLIIGLCYLKGQYHDDFMRTLQAPHQHQSVSGKTRQVGSVIDQAKAVRKSDR